jgi:2OG-Fe(II) oxygenase superfamily
MARSFEVRLEEKVTLVAHKLVPGQRIAIHNDYLVGEETHRLTVQLNRGLCDADGGLFLLFNSSDASDIHRILRPLSGSAIAFAIGPDSHHAVSRLHSGERYTLVYSFYAQ